MTRISPRARRSVQQQMRQVIIIDEPSDDTDDIFVSYQIFQLGGSVFFDPWHLRAVGGGGCRHGFFVISFRVCVMGRDLVE